MEIFLLTTAVYVLLSYTYNALQHLVCKLILLAYARFYFPVQCWNPLFACRYSSIVDLGLHYPPPPGFLNSFTARVGPLGRLISKATTYKGQNNIEKTQSSMPLAEFKPAINCTTALYSCFRPPGHWIGYDIGNCMWLMLIVWLKQTACFCVMCCGFYSL
jgi:hypothetical protein